MLRSLISMEQSVQGGQLGGSFLLMPLSAEIVVVTKKKINNKKAMSAMEPALTGGADFCEYLIM